MPQFLLSVENLIKICCFWEKIEKLENDDLCRQIKNYSKWNDIFCYIILDRLLNKLRIFLDYENFSLWFLASRSFAKLCFFFWKLYVQKNMWKLLRKFQEFFTNSENSLSRQTMENLVTLKQTSIFLFLSRFPENSIHQISINFLMKIREKQIEKLV